MSQVSVPEKFVYQYKAVKEIGKHNPEKFLQNCNFNKYPRIFTFHFYERFIPPFFDKIFCIKSV